MKTITIEITAPYTDKVASEMKECAVYDNTHPCKEASDWMENLVNAFRAQVLASFATPQDMVVEIDRTSV